MFALMPVLPACLLSATALASQDIQHRHTMWCIRDVQNPVSYTLKIKARDIRLKVSRLYKRILSGTH